MKQNEPRVSRTWRASAKTRSNTLLRLVTDGLCSCRKSPMVSQRGTEGIIDRGKKKIQQLCVNTPLYIFGTWFFETNISTPTPMLPSVVKVENSSRLRMSRENNKFSRFDDCRKAEKQSASSTLVPQKDKWKRHKSQCFWNFTFLRSIQQRFAWRIQHRKICDSTNPPTVCLVPWGCMRRTRQNLMIKEAAVEVSSGNAHFAIGSIMEFVMVLTRILLNREKTTMMTKWEPQKAAARAGHADASATEGVYIRTQSEWKPL